MSCLYLCIGSACCYVILFFVYVLFVSIGDLDVYLHNAVLSCPLGLFSSYLELRRGCQYSLIMHAALGHGSPYYSIRVEAKSFEISSAVKH